MRVEVQAQHSTPVMRGGDVLANNEAMGMIVESEALRSRNLIGRYPMMALRGRDFALKAGGPAMGTADSAYLPDDDIDGRPRPRGQGDLGAVQHRD